MKIKCWNINTEKKGFAKDEGSIRYIGHTKGIYEELQKEFKEREKQELEER
jgi:hypothetical protein